MRFWARLGSDPQPARKIGQKIVPSGEKCTNFLSPSKKSEIFKSSLKSLNYIFSIPIESFDVKTMKSKTQVLKTVEISFPMEFKLYFLIPTGWKSPTGSVRRRCSDVSHASLLLILQTNVQIDNTAPKSWVLCQRKISNLSIILVKNSYFTPRFDLAETLELRNTFINHFPSHLFFKICLKMMKNE